MMVIYDGYMFVLFQLCMLY